MENFKLSSEYLGKKQEEATDFQKKMDELIKSGMATSYVDAGLLLELAEDDISNIEKIEKETKKLSESLDSPIPIRELITRQYLTREIVEKIMEQNKSILVRGIWRTGNTSIMASVETVIGGDNVMHLSLIGAGSVMKGGMSLEDYLDEYGESFMLRDQVVKFIEKKEGKKDKELLKKIGHKGLEPLKYLDNYLSESGNPEKVVLVIDEATSLVMAPEAFEEINKISKLKNINVLMNLHRVGDYENLVADKLSDFEQVPLRALKSDEVKRIAKLRMPKSYSSLSIEDFNEIYNASGGRPAEVVSLCNYIDENYKENNNISELIKKVANSRDWGDYFEPNCYYKILNAALSEKDKELVKNILDNNGVDAESVREIGESLVEVGILKKEKRDGKEVFLINGTILENYLRENIKVEEE